MDLDSDYYPSRSKDINDLRLFESTFMTFVGGDSDHQTLFYFTIKELFTVLGWRIEILLLMTPEVERARDGCLSHLMKTPENLREKDSHASLCCQAEIRARLQRHIMQKICVQSDTFPFWDLVIYKISKRSSYVQALC